MQDGIAGTEQRAAGDNTISSVELTGQRREHPGHAGAGGKAGIHALQRGKPVLKHGDVVAVS